MTRLTRVVLVTLTAIAIQKVAVQGQTYHVIHSFSGGRDGGVPFSGLTMDHLGKLYGTTYGGGFAGNCSYYHGCGVVYKLARSGSAWVSNPLYTFKGSGYSDGAGPAARVVFGPDGALYGTTVGGGIGPCVVGINDSPPGCGTVFKLAPPPSTCKTASCPWAETILYMLTGGSDGAGPYASLVFDSAGNIYDTAAYGSNGGVVYKLVPNGLTWTENVVYRFSGQPPDGGMDPYAEVIFDEAGNIYGTTLAGGLYGFGTVYQLVHSGSGWAGSTIYSIPPTTPLWGGVIFDQAGNLYGGTYGNPEEGCGELFEVSPLGSGWNGQVLYQFPCTYGFGAGPAASLVSDRNGNLFGTTVAGGSGGCNGDCGAIFEAVHNADGTWSNIYLYEFSGGTDGRFPFSNVTIDSAGNLYGTASEGGANQNGCAGADC